MDSKISRDGHAHPGTQSTEKRYGPHRYVSWYLHDMCDECTWSQHCCRGARDGRGSHETVEEAEWLSDNLPSSASDMSEGCVDAKGTKANQKSRVNPIASTHRSETDIAAAQPDNPIQFPCLEESLSVQIEKLRDTLVKFTPKSEGQSQDAATTHSDTARGEAFEFRRFDRVYDEQLRTWRLVERKPDCQKDPDCVFRVRREYDVHGKLEKTRVDINSELLRTALDHIFRACGYSVVMEGVYDVDPRVLFHFRADISAYVKRIGQHHVKRERGERSHKVQLDQAAQCSLLLDFVREDFASVEERLGAMLRRGGVSYDLIWALFKPGTIVYTSTYENEDEPRCFKVETAYEDDGWITNGKYLDCKGERFSMGHY